MKSRKTWASRGLRPEDQENLRGKTLTRVTSRVRAAFLLTAAGHSTARLGRVPPADKQPRCHHVLPLWVTPCAGVWGTSCVRLCGARAQP